MGAQRIIGIIPARYASTRFPGKPLALIHGKPMIQVVCEQVAGAGLDLHVVATDDERIFNVVQQFGGRALLTRADHPSGTDRCGEAAGQLKLADDDVVINIQGDEPFISAREISLIAALFDRPDVQIGTLVKPFSDKARAENPNIVKAVLAADGRALYFSRYPIPYVRDPQTATPLYHQHLGIYAYRYKTLKALTRLTPSPLESCEKLEQLRWIENGYSIHTASCQYEGIGIDTPEDLARLEQENLFPPKHS
jgi:3-deoxy-manno-octulosonate cytidylyltransferase (CMP-KDO synthetase)